MRVPAVADVVPSDQVNIAASLAPFVIVYDVHDVMLAGRSLRESEARTDSMMQLSFIAWIVGLLVALVTAMLVEEVARH